MLNVRLGWRCVLGVVVAMLATSAHAEWFDRVNDGIMGTRIVVELWADDAAQANAAIDAVMAEMVNIDNNMSTYKPESEVSRVNRERGEGADA